MLPAPLVVAGLYLWRVLGVAALRSRQASTRASGRARADEATTDGDPGWTRETLTRRSLLEPSTTVSLSSPSSPSSGSPSPAAPSNLAVRCEYIHCTYSVTSLGRPYSSSATAMAPRSDPGKNFETSTQSRYRTPRSRRCCWSASSAGSGVRCVRRRGCGLRVRC